MAPGARCEFALAGVKVRLEHVRTPGACDENAFTSGINAVYASSEQPEENRLLGSSREPQTRSARIIEDSASLLLPGRPIVSDYHTRSKHVSTGLHRFPYLDALDQLRRAVDVNELRADEKHPFVRTSKTSRPSSHPLRCPE